jgi:hypothetical protein
MADVQQRYEAVLIGLVDTFHALDPLMKVLPFMDEHLASPLRNLWKQDIDQKKSVRSEIDERNLDERDEKQLLDALVSWNLKDIKGITQSAAIVVAHAAIEDAVNEYLLLTADVQSSLWLEEIRNERVKVADLTTRSYPDIVRQTVAAHVKSQWLGKPLPTKLNCLLKLCGRTPTSVVDGFHLNPRLVATFDELRHDIAHGRKVRVIIEDVAEAMTELWTMTVKVHDMVVTCPQFPHTRLSEIL